MYYLQIFGVGCNTSENSFELKKKRAKAMNCISWIYTVYPKNTFIPAMSAPTFFLCVILHLCSINITKKKKIQERLRVFISS